jgi:glycosyltransferase involved in cell wall biosynthesis
MRASAFSPQAPRVIVYRDRLLPFSETFVLAQANAMTGYAPVLAGRRLVRGVDLEGQIRVVASQGGLRGAASEARLLAGRPPAGLVESLAAHEPALIHAHFGPDALSALPLGRRLEVPLVVTFHGYDATESVDISQGASMWLYGLRRPGIPRRAARILAVSDYIRTRLLGLGFPPDRVQTHYIGVDTGSFEVAPLENRGRIVLAVGRFVEKKGFEHLIDAMAEVQRRVPGSELVLIGSGPREGALRRRAGAALGAHRIFGPCDAAEVRRWMARARVLAVPSVESRSGDTEGLPIVVLEALASGLPVVGSRHAGIPEAVQDGRSGHLVPERDAAALAARLADVLEDDGRWSAFSRQARRSVEARFELRAQTRELEAIYDRAREQPSNRGCGIEGMSPRRRSPHRARPAIDIHPLGGGGAGGRAGR